MANLSDYIVNFTSLDTLNSVTGRGATTTNDITIGNLTSTGIDDNATSTAITIDASENVGIGTTSPVSLGAGYKNIDVRHTTGGGVTLGDASNIHAYLFSDNNGVTLQSPGSRSIKFTTVSTERMRIDSSGNVGIGTASPDGTFHVKDAIAQVYIQSNDGQPSQVVFGDVTDASGGMIEYTSSNEMTFKTNNLNERMRIDSSGNVGIGTAAPDSKLQITTGTNNIIQHRDATHSTLTNVTSAITFSRTDGIDDLSAIMGWNDGGIALSGREGIAFATGGGVGYSSTVERMRIDSSGNTVAKPSGGEVTLGANGHLTSKQSLDVATAGGRYIGASNRGIVGQIRIEQTTTSADGGYVSFDTCASGSTSPTERMRINSSGDVGIGVVPDSFNTVDGALQVGTRNTITSFSNDIGIGYNHYYNSGWKYANTDVAARFSSNSGVPFLWQYAGSGSADGAITWSEAMRIDSSGDVFIKGGGQLKVERSAASNFSSFYTDTADSTIINNSWSNQKIVLTRDGNVGIGTTSPALASGWSTALHVNGSGSGAHISLTDTTTGATNTDGLVVGQYQANSYFINRENGFQAFYTNNAERMRIDSSGNVGIGTASPSYKLHVSQASSGALVNSFADDLFVESSAHAGITIGSGATSTGNLAFTDSGNNFVGYVQYNHGDNSMRLGSNASEAMRIDASGNLNLGDTTWYAAATNRRHLHIKGGTNGAFLALGTSGSGDAYLESDNSGGFNIWNRANGNMLFGTNNAERMRISNAGDVMINVSSPSGGNGGTGAFHVRQDNTSSTTAPILASNEGGSGGLILFSGNGGGVSTANRIYHGGSAVVYGTSSDERLKKNITPAPSALDVLHSVEAVSFDWKATDQHTKYGFIAQQFADVVPDAVIKGETEEDHWGMDYGKVTPFLLKAIQEQQVMIEELKAEVAALKGE